MISHQRQLSSKQSHFSYQTGEYSVHLRLCHPFAKEILNHCSILDIASDQFSMFHHASSGIRRIVTYTTERESFHFFCQWNRGNISVSPLHTLILESSEHFAVNWNDLCDYENKLHFCAEAETCHILEQWIHCRKLCDRTIQHLQFCLWTAFSLSNSYRHARANTCHLVWTELQICQVGI